MFKTATAAALILAAISTGASAQVTMKAGQYFTGTTFTQVADSVGICTALGVKAGNTNYGVYTVGATSGGVTAVSLVNAQQSGAGTTASPYSLAATSCVLDGWPGSVTPGTPAATAGNANCNPVTVPGVGTIYSYKLVPATNLSMAGNTLTALNAAGTAFTTSSDVQIAAFSSPLATPPGDGKYHPICEVTITSVGSYTGQ